jgi:hypothetical protein
MIQPEGRCPRPVHTGRYVEFDTAQLTEAIEDDIEETSRHRNHRLCLACNVNEKAGARLG